MHFLRVLGRSKCIWSHVFIVSFPATIHNSHTFWSHFFYCIFAFSDIFLTHEEQRLCIHEKGAYCTKDIIHTSIYTSGLSITATITPTKFSEELIILYVQYPSPLTKQTSYILHVAWIISSLQLYEFTLQSDKKKTRIVATGKKTQWQNGNYK